MSKILVVDDEKMIVKGIKFALEQDGMEVDCAYDGEEAINAIRDNEYDVVLLDVMLPGTDGFTVCRTVREFTSVPIIMVSARSDDADKIAGLDNGADDYVTKPFNILEVKARIKAILRRNNTAASRTKTSDDSILESGELRLDKNGRRLFINGREFNITAKEFDLLETLVANPGRVYSRDALMKIVWGSSYAGDARTVDVHIRRLREKIEEDPSEPRYVYTKWGAGYYYKV